MNDLDPMLREAMTRVRGPIDARPSLSDIRRRARRRNHRRMALTAGAVACTGVATAALIVRRDGAAPFASAPSGSGDSAATGSTIYLPDVNATTTTGYFLPEVTVDAAFVWQALLNTRDDPSGVALMPTPPDQEAAQKMPTPELFGCTLDACRAMYTYVVWHEIARMLGFSDVIDMQAINPNVEFTLPPVQGDVLQTSYFGAVVDTSTPTGNDETTSTLSLFEGIMLIDGGAPAGAMEDAYQRMPGYDRTIVPGTGKTSEQTMVMPIGDNSALASSIGAQLGVDGLDTWDPSFLGSPIQGMVAVIVGPDYWDRVQQAATASTTTTSSTSSTSIVP